MFWEIQNRKQITDNTQAKHNPVKVNNAKHSKTKLAWFSCLLRHLAIRKQGGLILQRSRVHMGQKNKLSINHCHFSVMGVIKSFDWTLAKI